MPDLGKYIHLFRYKLGRLKSVPTKKTVDSVQSLAYLIIVILDTEVIDDVKPGEKEPLHAVRQAVKS